MAVAPGWILTQGIHDLGIGFFAHLQSGGGPGVDLRTAINDDNDGGSPPEAAGSAQEKIEAARISIQKALECQAFIVSLFAKETTQLCNHLRSHLRLLERPITEDVDAMITAVDADDSARAVRDFVSRVNAVTLAYNPLSQRIADVARDGAGAFPQFALRDAAKAEMHANMLYSWAQTFLPRDTNTQSDMDKADKLKMVPYIVAMAYAVRVKLDVYYVESSKVLTSERQEYLERSSSTVEQFIKVLQVAIHVTLNDSTLLEVALDYHLALTTYIALKATLQASVQMILKPKEAPRTIVLWDDGLSGIRAIFGKDDSSPIVTNIPLNNAEEVIAWAKFIGQDLKAVQIDDLSKAVPLPNLLLALGAKEADTYSDSAAATLRFAPDFKSALLQLPSTHSLRTALHTKLAAAIDAEPAALSSSASIRNATQLAAVAYLNPRLVQTLSSHSNTVSSVALCLDSERLITSSWDKTAKVWSLSSGQVLRTFTKHTKDVNCAALFSDGMRAVSGGYDNYTVRIWSIDSATETLALAGHTGAVRAVSVSPDNRTVASASEDNTVKLWTVDSGQCEATFKGHSKIVWCVEFSVDGQSLASGSEDCTIKVWSKGSKTLERTIQGHSDCVREVAFTADGDCLVSGSLDKTIKVWKWKSGELVQTLTGHTGPVRCLALFSDGKRLATGSSDKSIRIWNLHSGKSEHVLEGHTCHVHSVAVSRGGRTLVSGSSDCSVKVWKLRR